METEWPTEIHKGHEIEQLGQNWRWILAAGIGFLILGVIAFMLPVASSIGLTIGLGALLLAGGIVHLLHAIKLRHRKGAASRFVQSALAIVTGGLMLRYPGAGVLGLALMLSFYFLVGAAVQWTLALALRPHEGWGWVLVSSMMSAALGVFILFNFPLSALWIPGTLLGIDLIFSGASMIAFSFSAHRAASPPRPATPSRSSTLRPSTVWEGL